MTKSGVEGAEQAGRVLKNIPKSLLKHIVKTIDVNARLMQSHIKEQHLTGGTTDTRLRVRSGRLRGSVIPIKTEIKGDTVEGGVSIGTIYARTHFGPWGQTTTITPKKGKYLTIPLPAAMTGAGVLKGTARASMGEGGVFGETFVAKSKAGNLIIFGKQRIAKGEKAGELRSRVLPLFLLKKSVVVKARVHPEDILNWISRKLPESFKIKSLEI